MRHLNSFRTFENFELNEGNILKRGLNKVGKSLSLGSRITSPETYSLEAYKSLGTKNLKWLINLFKGKNSQYKPNENTLSYLKDICKDLKTIIDKGRGYSISEKNESYRKISNCYNDLTSQLRYPLPKYDPSDKNQYSRILDILNTLYTLSYNDGN